MHKRGNLFRESFLEFTIRKSRKIKIVLRHHHQIQRGGGREVVIEQWVVAEQEAEDRHTELHLTPQGVGVVKEGHMEEEEG